MSAALIKIDGSILEGGGQILRNAVTLSVLLSKPVEIKNIRLGRSTPGLRPQHLTGMKLLADICRGNLTGCTVGSTTATLTPGPLESGKFLADAKTAGSVCLLMQVALPCVLFSPRYCNLTLRGGTNCEMAPQLEFFPLVLQPILEKFAIKFEVKVNRRGYYPKGGGEVQVAVDPVHHIEPITLTDLGQLVKVEGRSFVAGVLPIKIAKQMADMVKTVITEFVGDVPIEIEVVQEKRSEAVGNGNGISVVGITSTGCRLSGSALGKRGLSAEEVGKAAADELISNLKHGGCVDNWLQDQLVLFMALAKGKSAIKTGPLTLHTKTSIQILETMTEVKFSQTLVPNEGGEGTNCVLLECEGIGITNAKLT